MNDDGAADAGGRPPGTGTPGPLRGRRIGDGSFRQSPSDPDLSPAGLNVQLLPPRYGIRSGPWPTCLCFHSKGHDTKSLNYVTYLSATLNE